MTARDWIFILLTGISLILTIWVYCNLLGPNIRRWFACRAAARLKEKLRNFHACIERLETDVKFLGELNQQMRTQYEEALRLITAERDELLKDVVRLALLAAAAAGSGTN